MKTSVLATWKATTKTTVTSIVVPDGCRDLIMCSPMGEKPTWFVSPLFNGLHSISLASGTTMMGFRLRPGTIVNEEKLLASLSNRSYDFNEIYDRLDTFTTCKDAVEEALFCLASEGKSVALVAKELGTTPRTLQRLLIRETGRTPMFWMMLARARKAARALDSALSLVEIADLFGYADQAHMSRELKRWFSVSPAALRELPNILNQLYDKGYDDVETGVHSSIKKPFMSET